MKAIRIHHTGDETALIYEEIAAPAPKEGEALVKLSYAGLNYIDVYQRSGVYKLPLPATLGMEGVGVVQALGDGAQDARAGQRVAWSMALGSYAEYAVVPAWKLAPVPDAITDQQACALMLQGATAHYLARSTFALKPGDVCLVHAAAGGVGLLLTQVAKLCGARVIATVGSEEKAALAKKAGADDVILYRQHDFEAEVKRLMNGKGLDVIYDSVGKDTFMKGLNLLRPRGLMALYGGASGQVEPFDLQLLNAKGSLFVTRPSLGAYALTREEILGRCNDLFDWVAAGKLDVRIDQVFELKDAAQAHRYLEGRNTKGKVLLATSA